VRLIRYVCFCLSLENEFAGWMTHDGSWLYRCKLCIRHCTLLGCAAAYKCFDAHQIGCENTKSKIELQTCNEITARLNFDALDQLCSQTYSSPSTLCKSRMQALFISMGVFYKQHFGMYHHLIIVRLSTTSPLPDITQPTHHPSPLSSPY